MFYIKGDMRTNRTTHSVIKEIATFFRDRRRMEKYLLVFLLLGKRNYGMSFLCMK